MRHLKNVCGQQPRHARSTPHRVLRPSEREQNFWDVKNLKVTQVCEVHRRLRPPFVRGVIGDDSPVPGLDDGEPSLLLSEVVRDCAPRFRSTVRLWTRALGGYRGLRRLGSGSRSRHTSLLLCRWPHCRCRPSRRSGAVSADVGVSAALARPTAAVLRRPGAPRPAVLRRAPVGLWMAGLWPRVLLRQRSPSGFGASRWRVRPPPGAVRPRTSRPDAGLRRRLTRVSSARRTAAVGWFGGGTWMAAGPGERSVATLPAPSAGGRRCVGAALPRDYPPARGPRPRRWTKDSYLVDSASSHMLVSKIKPCMSKYKQSYCETANGSLNQLSFI